MPALLEYVRDEALPDRDEILARLASHDREVVLRILTLLCPCRNTCYDEEIWSKLPAIRASQWDFEVREAASHAIGTLHEKARVDTRSRELIARLRARADIRLYAGFLHRRPRRRPASQDLSAAKLATRDVPTLVESLASDDEVAIRDALRALCPDGGRKLPKRVWRAILDERRSLDPGTRAKALRAAARLELHARTCARHA
jgi:hypothetical protein